MLETFALAGRTLESAILYGSEPPAVETYWRNAKGKGWLVKEFHRSKHNKKEKEVDCAISVDITKTGYNFYGAVQLVKLIYNQNNRLGIMYLLP